MDYGPACIVGSLALPSLSQLINLVVLPPAFFPRRVTTVRFYITCAVADSYSSGSLAGTHQFVVSVVSYFLGKRVSCSSVGHFSIHLFNRDSIFI